MTRREQEPPKPSLEVIGGLHSGVSLALDDGTYSIGSTPDADIVLRDTGVTKDHAIVRIEGNSVRIEAVGGDLGVGGELVTQGHGCKLRMPVDIAMGNARLKLSISSEADAGLWGRLQPVGNFISRRPLAAAGGVICCALAVSVATRGAPPPVTVADTTTAEPNLAVTKTAYADVMSKIPEKPAESVTRAGVEAAAGQLQDKLKAMSIHSLKVTTADKRVLAAGAIRGDKAAAWTTVQQWFDETFQGRILLTANVAIGESKAAPPLQLQAIWFGERPYVITEAGAHFYEGSLLDNGWILQKIAEDRIVLEREGEALALTYR